VSLLSVVGYWNSAYEGLQILQGLPNSVRFLRTLRLDPGRGPSTSALFIDVFRPSSFPGLRPFRCQCPEPALLPPGGPGPTRAFPNPGSSAAEAAIEPDLPQPELRPVFQPVEA
jgi:hypothetical protein